MFKMKNKLKTILYIYATTLLLIACSERENIEQVKFGVSADYPPFEYYNNDNQLVGFDIELGMLVAQHLGKEAVFEDMQFSNIFPAIQNGTIDAGISTITFSDERQKNFDFSNAYYRETLAMVYQKDKPIKNVLEIEREKIACQLGSTMEMWLKEHAKDSELIIVDNNNQAIEALKASHASGVLMDKFQAQEFVSKNEELSYSIIAESDRGYAIAIKKDSELKDKINLALEELDKQGKLQELADKWLK